MGKYTNLARKIEETEPQKKVVVNNLDNTYKHSILIDTASNTAATLHDNDTNLRTTNLTNLTEQAGVTSVFRCIPLPPIGSAGEVLELARNVLPELKEEDRVDLDELKQANSPPASLVRRDPLVCRGTDKARFFKGDWRTTWPRDFKVYEGAA
jgi:hypothetical protein